MKPSIKFEVFSASCFEGVFDCMPKNFWGRVTSVTPLLGKLIAYFCSCLPSSSSMRNRKCVCSLNYLGQEKVNKNLYTTYDER